MTELVPNGERQFTEDRFLGLWRVKWDRDGLAQMLLQRRPFFSPETALSTWYLNDLPFAAKAITAPAHEEIMADRTVFHILTADQTRPAGDESVPALFNIREPSVVLLTLLSHLY